MKKKKLKKRIGWWPEEVAAWKVPKTRSPKKIKKGITRGVK
jgi:hypothetical protein